MNVEFDSGKNKITYREKELLLNNNEFKLAILLLEKQGEMVEKSTILDTVWKNKVVTEGSIKRSISLLRKAFYDLEANVEITAFRGVGYSISTKLNVFIDNTLISLDSEEPELEKSEPLYQGITSKISTKAKPILTLLISLNLAIGGYFLYQDFAYSGLSQISPYMKDSFISSDYHLKVLESQAGNHINLITLRDHTAPKLLFNLISQLNTDMTLFYQVEGKKVYFAYALEDVSQNSYANNYIISVHSQNEKIKNILEKF
ncbi:winged helix-turn-helix domain-containing protein [Vibrio chagasii]|uniref:winged helix-turn-helix domain-containing protein n=1 Tax=Vibrio chagasii TaxID=170679 RepID=UPI000FE35B2C